MASSKGQSSRQKMINLMYLVFIAMLALNIPTEVLQGFDLVNDNLLKHIEVVSDRNNQIYQEIVDSHDKNPTKAKDSFDKATDVKMKADSLFNFIQSLKDQIAEHTDGKHADANDLKNKDNLDASSEVMLAPGSGKGSALKKAIDNYRKHILEYVTDSAKINLIASSLSTEPTDRARRNRKNWVHASFEGMPSIAAITYMSELQSNIRQAEGEALTYFLRNVDLTDYRVNDLSAFVISESNVVMQGETYKANIVLAAVDTTQRPTITVNGRTQTAGFYTELATSLGTKKVKGFIEMMSRDGLPLRREFEQQYTVMEPMATIAPLLMDVVYAGINNPISISVPGVINSNVNASAEGGTLVRNGNNWIAKPAKIGQKFTITVSTNANGKSRVVARKEFRINALPDPTAYISLTDDIGNPRMFKRGVLPRAALLNTTGIKAAINDGILDIPFTVLSFRTVIVDGMGNAMTEMSDGTNFSGRQFDQFRRMERGTFFFISNIKVKGPDGSTRDISPMEIRLN